MSADGSTKVYPLRAQEPGVQLTPEEAQRRLSQLRAAVQGDPLGWAQEILRQVLARPNPPDLERTPIAPYLASAPESIKRAAQRAYCRGEGERNLRASLRAEAIFRAAGRPEVAAMTQYHRERWAIREPAAADMHDREAQLRTALDRRYGR